MLRKPVQWLHSWCSNSQFPVQVTFAAPYSTIPPTTDCAPTTEPTIEDRRQCATPSTVRTQWCESPDGSSPRQTPLPPPRVAWNPCSSPCSPAQSQAATRCPEILHHCSVIDNFFYLKQIFIVLWFFIILVLTLGRRDCLLPLVQRNQNGLPKSITGIQQSATPTQTYCNACCPWNMNSGHLGVVEGGFVGSSCCSLPDLKSIMLIKVMRTEGAHVVP